MSESDIIRFFGLGGTAASPTSLLEEIAAIEASKSTATPATAVRAESAKVKDIMTKEVAIVSVDATLDQAAWLMLEKDVNRLPVVEGNRLVGIVARGDLVRALAGTAGVALRHPVKP